MEARLRLIVRERAANRCEYCLLPESLSPWFSLQIEHIRPRKHHGGDELDNLALACIDCNLHKGPNIAGIDEVSGVLTELFNPRQHQWLEHFEFSGPFITGKTTIGRVTIDVLHMNSVEQVTLRGLHRDSFQRPKE